MFERLKYLYQQNKLDDLHLNAAVSKEWINEKQKEEILKCKKNE